MSAPTNNPAAKPPTGPNGGPPKIIRRPKAADPLVRPRRKPAAAARPPAAAGPAANGAPSKPSPAQQAGGGARPAARADPPKIGIFSDEFSTNGFSGPLLSDQYVDYPLVTTKRSLREGLKHHIARFASKKSVDPRDESQFTRPVRLQRRDPRAKPQHTDTKEKNQGDQKSTQEPSQQTDDGEREEQEARKAARERERAENLAQIAPSVGQPQKRSNMPKQKTQQVYKADMTPEEIAKARVKYEEALPWHLEDFDNKNTWVGNYEAALSETHAIFVLENTGKMRMVPIEKWYKFGAKNQFKALTIEEAEKFMAKKVKDPRWFMEKQQEHAEKKELEKFAKQRKVYAGKAGVSAGAEADDMDFEEDRFADDEEHDDLFNDDEDTKTAEKRIKEDQLKANVFDLKEEKDYEKEEIREQKEREARRVLGKGVRKALQRREKNFDYSSGSDVNPYSDEESSDDTEAEELKQQEQKAAEEEKNQKESTKGSNTPSGRQKHTDSSKKSSPRKRPGSPNGSDASGTDSSRKKTKSKHVSSHSASPPATSVPAGKKRARNTTTGTAGSASDDGGAASGGEMSESGKTKKPKLNPSQAAAGTGTPQGSRAGSPAAPARSFSGSRASSPDASGSASTKGPTRVSTPGPSTSSSQAGFPTPAEVHAAIPQSGITSWELLRQFRPRIGGDHQRFIAIVKDVGVYGKEDRLLRPGVLKQG